MVKRSGINLYYVRGTEYSFINHIKGGTWGPYGAGFAATALTFMQMIDANGYPNNAGADNHGFGGGFPIPDHTNFSGQYVLQWTGDARFQFQTGTWSGESLVSGTNYVRNGNGDYSGTNIKLLVTRTGAGDGLPSTQLYQVLRTGHLTSTFMTNLRFYRLEDETDFLAGKIFRTKWKQSYADHNPGFIRFLNWLGTNNSKQCRWEHCAPIGYAAYSSEDIVGYNWVASPPYGATTGANQMILAGVTGTPASMQHGEIATFRIGAGAIGGGGRTITAIQNNTVNAQITSAGHGFSNGDIVVIRVSSGMPEIHYRVGVVAVVSTDIFTIGCNTTGFTAFVSGVADPYISLAVGTGSNRDPTGASGAKGYPVVFNDGISPATHFGSGYIVTNDYKTVSFDKDYVASNEVTGAWLFNDTSGLAFGSGAPLEICTALINELMAMTRTDGGAVGPIDMWINMPHRGLLSIDPDYSSGSNWIVNAVNTVLNHATPAKRLNSACKLYVEHSNETWNSGGSAFSQTPGLARKGQIRWGAASSASDYVSMHSLRSWLMAKDILAAGFDMSRIRLIMAGQGTLGYTSLNSQRCDGNSNMLNDALNPTHATPISNHDAFAWAGYFSASVAFDSANVATQVTAWLSHAGNPTAQEADCAVYVAGIVNAGVGGSGETTYRYGTTLLPAYNTAMASRGKMTLMYEGGWDHSTASGHAGWVVYAAEGTAQQTNYFYAVKRSTAWANALKDFHNYFDNAAYTSTMCSSDYVFVGNRWGHFPNDSYAAGVENAAFDQAYTTLSVRNSSGSVATTRTYSIRTA